MFVYGIKTGVTTQCRNKDVIKTIRKDIDNFIIAETLEELQSKIDEIKVDNSKSEPKKALSKMTKEELMAAAEESGINAESLTGLTNKEIIAVINKAREK